MRKSRLRTTRRALKWRFWMGLFLTLLGGIVVIIALAGGIAPSHSAPAPAPSASPSSAAPPTTTEPNGMVVVSGETPEEQSYLNDAVDELNNLIQDSESYNFLLASELTAIKNDMASAQNARAAALSAASPEPSSSPTPTGPSPLSSVASVGTALAGIVTAIVGLLTALVSWRQAKSKGNGQFNASEPKAV